MPQSNELRVFISSTSIIRRWRGPKVQSHDVQEEREQVVLRENTNINEQQ